MKSVRARKENRGVGNGVRLTFALEVRMMKMRKNIVKEMKSHVVDFAWATIGNCLMGLTCRFDLSTTFYENRTSVVRSA